MLFLSILYMHTPDDGLELSGSLFQKIDFSRYVVMAAILQE